MFKIFIVNTHQCGKFKSYWRKSYVIQCANPCADPSLRGDRRLAPHHDPTYLRGYHLLVAAQDVPEDSNLALDQPHLNFADGAYDEALAWDGLDFLHDDELAEKLDWRFLQDLNHFLVVEVVSPAFALRLQYIPIRIPHHHLHHLLLLLLRLDLPYIRQIALDTREGRLRCLLEQIAF